MLMFSWWRWIITFLLLLLLLLGLTCRTTEKTAPTSPMSEFNITINLDLNNKVENKKRRRKRVRRMVCHVHGKQLGTKGKQKCSDLRREGSTSGAAQSRHNGALARHPSAPTPTQPERCPPHRTAEPSQAASLSSASTHSQAASAPAGSKDVGCSPSAGSLCKPTAAAPPPAGIPSKYLAIDCEMVGTGPKGSVSQLGRCSVVSYDGDVVYDKFIKPPVPVTDFRTRWSGIRPRNLANATPYSVARKEVKPERISSLFNTESRSMIVSSALADPEAARGKSGDRPRRPQRLQSAELFPPARLDQRHVADPLAQREGRPGCDRVCVPEEAHQGHFQPGHSGGCERFPTTAERSQFSASELHPNKVDLDRTDGAALSLFWL